MAKDSHDFSHEYVINFYDDCKKISSEQGIDLSDYLRTYLICELERAVKVINDNGYFFAQKLEGLSSDLNSIENLIDK